MIERISLFKTTDGEVKSNAAYDVALAHWPVPYDELDISTQFGDTHLIMSGSVGAPPIILLHGQNSCAISWIYNVVDLSKNFRVCAVDTMGDMGKSKPIHLPSSREEYAQWLLEVFEQLQLEKADLVGISYGGFLAINFALANPKRVNRIVLLAPGIPNFGSPTLQWANYGMPMLLMPSRFTVSRFINGVSTKGFSTEDPVHDHMIIAMMNMKTVSFMRPVFTDEELKRASVPILLLIGDHEKMYEPHKALDCATRLIPNIKTELITDASHFLNSDQPEQINSRILNFLNPI